MHQVCDCFACSVEPAIGLARKLISALESIEKLPLFNYDLPGSGYGLQILTRRLRFRLERAPGETTLIDRSGRSLKMEPLTSVSELERYLLKMVSFCKPSTCSISELERFLL